MSSHFEACVQMFNESAGADLEKRKTRLKVMVDGLYAQVQIERIVLVLWQEGKTLDEISDLLTNARNADLRRSRRQVFIIIDRARKECAAALAEQ